MSERLIIKNFGPIKSVELELGEFVVLIGDQGTGKSTVAKVLIGVQNTVFRDLLDINFDPANKDTHLFFEHLRIVGIINYLNVNSEIHYSCSTYSFDFKSGVVVLDKSKINLDRQISYNFNYIPSERSLAITLSDSLFALMQTETALPQLFLRFGDKFQKARRDKESFDYRNIFGVKYMHKEGRDVIILPSGKEIFIYESSSGIQGAISLLIVFDFIAKTSTSKTLLVIEEPELNCFPETQYKIIKHFIESNISENNSESVHYKNQILITTHSPYILTSLNNLMYAYQVGKEEPEKTNKIIEEKYWLNPDDVSAYMMLPNGQCENILDKEGLIKAEKIDEVSRKLNIEFDLLQNIELGISENK